MDKESMSTELRIYFSFAETGNEVLSEEDIEFVKSVLEDHGLFYEHYDKYNISTEFFVDTDENMEEISEIESKIGSYFNDLVTDQFIVDDEIYGSQPGTYQTWIAIEEPDSPGKDADDDESSSDWREFKQ